MSLNLKISVAALSAAIACSALNVYANIPTPYVPVGCPQEQSCEKKDCTKNCDPAPIFNSCEEIQNWKIKFFEKRACLYEKLCMTQEQRVQGKCIDEKYFDEIAPLKLCKMQEEKKLEEMKCKKCSLKVKREQKQKIKDLKTEIKDKKQEHEECFLKILNCKQQEKYKELKKDKCKKHKKPKFECGCK